GRSDRAGERIWHASVPLMLTAVSLASALLFTSLFSIVVILCLAVIGIYAGKGPVWAVSTEWLSASTAAAGLAQINAISNLAGFGTTYVMGFIRDATGSFSLALMPLVILSAVASLAIVMMGGTGKRVEINEAAPVTRFPPVFLRSSFVFWASILAV